MIIPKQLTSAELKTLSVLYEVIDIIFEEGYWGSDKNIWSLSEETLNKVNEMLQEVDV